MKRSAQPLSYDQSWQGEDQPLAFALNQLAWYTRNNRSARIGHYAIEISQLLVAAGTTLAAAAGASAILTASLAALTLVLTGLRQVFGFREKWATMTVATVRLEHAINQYRLRPQVERAEASKKLVDEVDAIVADETRGWSERLRTSPATTGASGAAAH
jgi:hypothetical protein